MSDTPTKPVRHDEQRNIQRMQTVLLLLESLAVREEVTVRLILGHLYDIGSQKLIDQKVRYRIANTLLNWIAKYTKPVALSFGVRWFKRNAPELIADWLYLQVSFEESLLHESTASEITVTETSVTELPPANGSSSKQLPGSSREIQRLRTQVRWLSSLSIGAIALVIGALLH